MILVTTIAAACTFGVQPALATAGEARTDSVISKPDPSVLHPMSKQAFDKACKEQGFSQGVTLTGNNAYSIRCVNEDGSLQTFNERQQIHDFVQQACQDTYPEGRKIDRLATMGKTYTAWECADYDSFAGVPDLKKWCNSQGLKLISSRRGYPAYRWFCANSSRTRVRGIPVDQVCVKQFGENALDRVYNVYGRAPEDAWNCIYTP
jgi:hypothetical protein